MHRFSKINSATRISTSVTRVYRSDIISSKLLKYRAFLRRVFFFSFLDKRRTALHLVTRENVFLHRGEPELKRMCPIPAVSVFLSLDTLEGSYILSTIAFSAGLYNVRNVCDRFLFGTSQTFTRAYLIAARCWKRKILLYDALSL